MECERFDIESSKAEYDAIGQLIHKTAEDVNAAYAWLKEQYESARPKQAGYQVFKDGKDITHRCKVSQTDVSFNMVIGADPDELIMQLPNPQEMVEFYGFRRNKETGQGDVYKSSMPRWAVELLTRVLPGWFVDYKSLIP